MSRLYTIIFTACFLLAGASFNKASACYAYFVHTNACVGDTVWFYGLDYTAVHTWDFGDTTVNNPNIAFDDTAYHVFTTAGTYYVTHFVNIGAEWAFETQEVTIGTDCFNAGFSYVCSGSFHINFQNESIGNNLSYSWNFGEPSSGTDDTSTSMTPYHTYSAPGNYIVTLIIDNGTTTDTSVQTLAVDTSCLSAFPSYNWNPCAGDTTFFFYNFIGATSVFWDFGDPASGISNFSTLQSPTHIFAVPGVYQGMVIYSNGIDTDTLPVITRVVDCNVWPGDANRDGYVTGEDFFAIALNYGDTGAARNNASSTFSSQPAADWASAGFNFMYLQDLLDKKYADCNGDGMIDSDDASVIAQNFGMSHQSANNLSSIMITNPSDPHLSITLPASVSGLSTITANLTYGDSLIHTPVYGFCVYIDYDPMQIDASSITVDFTGSFLDTVSVSNLITFFYNDMVNNRIIIVEARKDKNGMNGYGLLASVTFNSSPGYSGILELNIGYDTKVMSNSVFTGGTWGNVQSIFKVNIDNGSTQVSLGIPDINMDRLVSVYPVPAGNFFHIHVKNATGNYSVKITDAMGRVLSRKYPVTNHQLIDIQELSSGLYFILLEGTDWISNTKMLIER